MVRDVELSPPPSDNRGGGLVVPIQSRGEPGVLRISILMCGARNGGPVMSTRLWCIYWLKALLCLAKGRGDVS